MIHELKIRTETKDTCEQLVRWESVKNNCNNICCIFLIRLSVSQAAVLLHDKPVTRQRLHMLLTGRCSRLLCVKFNKQLKTWQEWATVHYVLNCVPVKVAHLTGAKRQIWSRFPQQTKDDTQAKTQRHRWALTKPAKQEMLVLFLLGSNFYVLNVTIRDRTVELLQAQAGDGAGNTQ